MNHLPRKTFNWRYLSCSHDIQLRKMTYYTFEISSNLIECVLLSLEYNRVTYIVQLTHKCTLAYISPLAYLLRIVVFRHKYPAVALKQAYPKYTNRIKLCFLDITQSYNLLRYMVMKNRSARINDPFMLVCKQSLFVNDLTQRRIQHEYLPRRVSSHR